MTLAQNGLNAADVDNWLAQLRSHLLAAITRGEGRAIHIEQRREPMEIWPEHGMRQFIPGPTIELTIIYPCAAKNKSATNALSPENFINTTVVGLQFGELTE
jgi:hypothetical protein